MAKRTGKEPFVSKEDRPAVQLKSDTPVNTLTVRDLVTLLGVVGGTRKDFWDGKSWQKDDFDSPIIWKRDIKEQKDKEKEKDFKEGKEHKDHKEKREIKEVNAEKLEVDAGGVLESSPDPRLEQVIRAVSGISAKVDQLADQVAALKKGKG